VNTTKIEGGVDIRLPGRRKLSIIAYEDRTTNGFASMTEYLTYPVRYFTPQQGLIITPGQATQVDIENPAFTKTMWTTTGRIGNTDVSINRGVEFDCDLGEVRALRTSFYLSGAWSETKTWSTDRNTASIKSELLPASYASVGLTPVKVVYPSGQDFARYRRLLTTLRAVTHIPALHMVASVTAQAVWHNSNWDYVADKEALGYISTDLQYHSLDGETTIGFPGGQVAVADLAQHYTDKEPTKSPVTWNLSARLTKEFSRSGGLSFYVNNALFYEPFLTGNKTTTLSQRNTGTFQFGAELYLNL
jgi:hypothetical protein